MDSQTKTIIELLQECNSKQRQYIFRELRQEFKIHPIEDKLNITAEIILDAINKDASGLTYRMLRGVIAESAFEIEVLKKLNKWENITPKGDLPYDFLIRDLRYTVSVQVKLQRSKNQTPMTAKSANKKFSDKLFVVETQKTRGGIDPITKQDTRPYKFGEFDILAVSMQPSTGSWADFRYTVANWLLPRTENNDLMEKFQPVSLTTNKDWTENLEECIEWLQKGIKKQVAIK